MPVSGIFDSNIEMLGQALSLRTRQHEAISANIANAETPGYARLQMDFQKTLAAASGSADDTQAVTHPKHMQAGAGDAEDLVYRQHDPGVIGDGNNVVMEQEMMDLAENQIRYEAAIQMLNKKFSMLKFVIQERA